MAEIKKTSTVAAPVVKAPEKTEMKAEVKAEVKAAAKPVAKAAEKPAVKPVEKTAEKPVENAAAKKEVKTPVKKAPAKKAPVKKAPAKKAVEKAAEKPAAKKAAEKAVKQIINLQFAGKSYTMEDIVKIAKDVWKYDLHKNDEEYRSLEIYVKPEESVAYYVFNGDITGSFFI